VTNLTIIGGHVHATGNYGAGIGGGWIGYDSYASASVVVNLTILGGIINAESLVQGAGIGCGTGTLSLYEPQSGVHILGGDITASAVSGAGIGEGYYILRFPFSISLIAIFLLDLFPHVQFPVDL
jgi:hypothetical protein